MRELLRDICAISGISGDEGRVSDFVINHIKNYCEYSIDPLGNVIAHKKGVKPAAVKLMLSAHMDEVGMMVTHITSDGLLKLDMVGGVDPSVVAGRRVLVGREGIHGILGLVPVHLLSADAREKSLKADALYIDIGVTDRAEAEKLVAPGDSVVFESAFAEFGDGLVMDKALDDRAGCALMIRLIQSELPYDCTFAFTVQEEVGCIGGRTAAYGVRPDIGIAVETTTAADLPTTPSHKQVCRLGAGPVISFMDRGAVYDRELYRRGMELAKRRGIPCQTKEGIYGGNESRSVQTTATGAKIMAVSMPCRYLHSPSCTLDMHDVEQTYELLRALIEELAE